MPYHHTINISTFTFIPQTYEEWYYPSQFSPYTYVCCLGTFLASFPTNYDFNQIHVSLGSDLWVLMSVRH